MKRLVLLAVAVLLVAGLLGGCGGGGGDDAPKNYFVGRWQVPGFQAVVTFANTTYTLTGPANLSGPYSYQGEYPDYVVTITANNQNSSGNVHFFSENQFRACFQGDCTIFNKI